MTPHVLDRPIWGALARRQASLSVGDERARRYLGDISPLAAAADDSPESLSALAAIAPGDGALVLLQLGEIPLLPGLEMTKSAKGVQMVAWEPVAVSPAISGLFSSRKRTPRRCLRWRR
ncbi:MAG: hypothetical protein ACREXP_00555 [Steroidobacteraceae bacterium]